MEKRCVSGGVCSVDKGCVCECGRVCWGHICWVQTSCFQAGSLTCNDIVHSLSEHLGLTMKCLRPHRSLSHPWQRQIEPKYHLRGRSAEEWVGGVAPNTLSKYRGGVALCAEKMFWGTKGGGKRSVTSCVCVYKLLESSPPDLLLAATTKKTDLANACCPCVMWNVLPCTD